LDPFSVTVTIPSGAAFNSLGWTNLMVAPGLTQLSATVEWLSCNDVAVTVSTQLPY
jgi:hypothetical protein